MKQQNQSEYTYYAFISYSSKDMKWGKRLQRKLEHYRMPATVCAERGWKRKPMTPVFFAPYDIQPGGLSEELKNKLSASKNLVVICSPNSAQSGWVGKEIEYFHELGRDKNIHFFIIDGIPNSGNPSTECFNPVVKKLGLPEILGANIHEKIFWLPWLNRERAYVQLISKLLNVEFDSIWQRHKRQMVAKIISVLILSILFVLSIITTIRLSSSYDGSICFSKAPAPELYEGHGSLKIILDNDTITQEVDNTDSVCIIKNIPGEYRYKEVRCKFNMFGYGDIDTVIHLSDRPAIVNIYREPVIYGHIEGQIVKRESNFTPVVGVKVSLGQVIAYTDKDGFFSFDVPIGSQNSNYYDATVQYDDIKQDVKLYPMRQNSENTNLIILD